MILAINEALAAYKEKHGEMPNRVLAEKIYPEKTKTRAKQLFSRICNGHDYSTITPDVIMSICRVLETTPNQLFKIQE